MRVISFDPLWKKLVDLKMSKSELAEKAKLSRSTLHQLTQDQSVTLDTVLRICQALDCDIIDVVEMKHEAHEALSADGRFAD